MTWNLDFNTCVLAGVAVLQLINTYYSRKTEKNTNSIVTALVQTTKVAAHAAGMKEEKDKQGGDPA